MQLREFTRHDGHRVAARGDDMSVVKRIVFQNAVKTALWFAM